MHQQQPPSLQDVSTNLKNRKDDESILSCRTDSLPTELDFFRDATDAPSNPLPDALPAKLVQNTTKTPLHDRNDLSSSDFVIESGKESEQEVRERVQQFRNQRGIQVDRRQRHPTGWKAGTNDRHQLPLISLAPDPITCFAPDLYERYPKYGHVLDHVVDVLAEEFSIDAAAPTPVQCQAIPVLMDNDLDLLACAPTGSGKTLAYLVPILVMRCSAVILVPTRELAEQTSRVASYFADRTKSPFRLRRLSCKEDVVSEVKKMQCTRENGDHAVLVNDVEQGGVPCLVVATPLTAVHAIDHCRRNDVQRKLGQRGLLGSLFPSQCHMLVLDEADKLLEPCLLEAVDAVLSLYFDKNQSSALRITNSDSSQMIRPRIHCFSATLPPNADELARSICVAPLRINVAAKGGMTRAVDSVSQSLLFCGKSGDRGKMVALQQMLADGYQLVPPVLIFVSQQSRCESVAREIRYALLQRYRMQNRAAQSVLSVGKFQGERLIHRVASLHAGLDARSRQSALEQFRTGETFFLVCTDVLARGIDFRCVNTVVNYDVPESGVAYVHRIGRTGRAGRKGAAITLFCADEAAQARTCANVMRLSGYQDQVPQWLVDWKPSLKQKKTTGPRRSPSKRQRQRQPRL